eukprot:6391681-Amphidinium_carterae.1
MRYLSRTPSLTWCSAVGVSLANTAHWRKPLASVDCRMCRGGVLLAVGRRGVPACLTRRLNTKGKALNGSEVVVGPIAASAQLGELRTRISSAMGVHPYMLQLVSGAQVHCCASPNTLKEQATCQDSEHQSSKLRRCLSFHIQQGANHLTTSRYLLLPLSSQQVFACYDMDSFR